MDWFEKNTYPHELKYVHNAFDGDVLKVKILVKEFKTEEPGNRIYLVQAVEIEAPASFRGASTVLGDQARLPHPPAGVSSIFAQMVGSVNGDGVSKQGCPIKIRVAKPAVDRRCPSLLFYVAF